MGGFGDDEAAVWNRARDGDASAFAQLYDAHRDRVYGQALRFTGSAHDAEDVAAMVFLEAWRRRASVRVVNGSVLAWLLVAVNNVSRNVLRSRRRYHALLSRLPRGATDDATFLDIDERLDDSARDARLRDVFAQLSAQDQDILTLCVIEELSIAEAARALAIPDGTVKSRLSRAKRRLGALAADPASECSVPSGGAQ